MSRSEEQIRIRRIWLLLLLRHQQRVLVDLVRRMVSEVIVLRLLLARGRRGRGSAGGRGGRGCR